MHGEKREREGVRGRDREGVEDVREEESEEVGGVRGKKTKEVERDRGQSRGAGGSWEQLNRKEQENHHIDIGYKCQHMQYLLLL